MVKNLVLKPRIKTEFTPGDRVLYRGLECPSYLGLPLVIRTVRTNWDKPYCDAWMPSGLLTTWVNLEDLQLVTPWDGSKLKELEKVWTPPSFVAIPIPAAIEALGFQLGLL